METKKCYRCKEDKGLDEYNKKGKNIGGLTTKCKQCILIVSHEYNQTRGGLITKIYSGQICSSKKRCHKTPTYTKTELVQWIYKQPMFEDLYNNWVQSDYDTWMKPSVDRIDDNIGYTMENIQLMTWKENNKKSKFGKNKEVLQILNNKIIAGYKSLKEASKKT